MISQDTAEVADFLRSHAALTLFLCIAVGYWLGRVRFGQVRIGGICGTVIVALIVGQTGVQIAPGAAGLSFSLFVYSLGYLGGPAFLSGLTRRTIALMVFPVLQFALALAVTLIAAWALGLSTPTALGLLTGASSQSAAMGAASGLLPASDTADLTTSFAVSYLISILVTVVIVSQVMPRFLPVASAGAGSATPTPVPPDVIGRAFRFTGPTPTALTTLKARIGHRVVITQVVRADRPDRPDQPDAPDRPGAPADDDLVRDGDVVRLIGSREVLATAVTRIGTEVTEVPIPSACPAAIDVVDVVVSPNGARTVTVDGLRENNVVPVAVRRRGQHLGTGDHVALRPGDVVGIAGDTTHVTRAATRLGTIRTRGATTDFAFLGAGLAIGIGIGFVTLRFGDVALSLGSSAAVLLTGIVIGWANSRRHTLGPYDPAAAEVVKDLGLAIFIACTALTAAPGAWQFFRQYGVVLPALAAFIVIAAAATSMLIATRLLRLRPLLTLGVLAGQQSSSPTMSALQARYASSEPLHSYVPVYAAATILGPVLMPAVIPLIHLVTH